MDALDLVKAAQPQSPAPVAPDDLRRFADRWRARIRAASFLAANRADGILTVVEELEELFLGAKGGETVSYPRR